MIAGGQTAVVFFVVDSSGVYSVHHVGFVFQTKCFKSILNAVKLDAVLDTGTIIAAMEMYAVYRIVLERIQVL